VMQWAEGPTPCSRHRIWADEVEPDGAHSFEHRSVPIGPVVASILANSNWVPP
jgi:hypothetical protein